MVSGEPVVPWLELMHPFAQLFRAGQVETAPGGGFGLIAQLFKVIRLQILRDLVTRVGGNHLFQQFCRPAVITLLVRFLRQVDDTGRTAQRLARNVYPSPPDHTDAG